LLVGPDGGYAAELRDKLVELATIKTVAAFLNSRDGGTLLIGVADDSSIHGLEPDYESLRSEEKKDRDDRDLFQLHLGNLLANACGPAAAANVTAQIQTINGQDIWRVHVQPSGHPIAVTDVEVDDNGQHIKKKDSFFVRVINGTRRLTDDDRDKYIAGRW